MPAWFRVALVVIGLGAIAAAIGFLLNVPWLVRVWPYGGPMYDTAGQSLGRIFIASILAAVGAPIVWAGIANEMAGSGRVQSTR